MTAQVIQLAERRRTAVPARETQDQVDELRADHTVRCAESLLFARRVHALQRRAMFASVKDDRDAAEQLMAATIRLAIQEETRVLAALGPDDGPVSVAA